MSNAADTEFHIRREHQERCLAERARNAEGRRVHLEMANRYAQLIAEAGAVPHPPPPMRIPT